MYWVSKIINKRNLFISTLAIIVEWFAVGSLNWSLFAHPISVFAHFIDWLLETNYRYSHLYGAFLNCVLMLMGLALGYGFQSVLGFNLVGLAFEVLVVAVLFAHKCLMVHVSGVLDRVYNSELSVSRGKLAMIVGRDVTNASEHELCSVAILSLVENFCDATFSPLLYYLFFGLPGLFVYKIVELADSIYGNYRRENRVLGVWIAAFDDILNYAPSRILGVLFLIVFYVLSLGKYKIVSAYKDGYSLVCLNNATCEAAVAWYLGIKLNGNRRYGDVLVVDRQFNACGRNANGIDISCAQHVINVTFLLIMLLVALALFFLI
ncbi:cobalamin biosynthesis protein [Candidatus Hodgkinia cicadicola]